jgi:hypothetical protein
MGYRRKVREANKAKQRRKNQVRKELYNSFNRQCLKKLSYHSEKKVISKIGEAAAEGRTNLRYYLCPFCEFWHISHKAMEGQKFIS